MELCEGGELADVLKERKTFSEEDTKKIMFRLASAVSYLHKKGDHVVHEEFVIWVQKLPADQACMLPLCCRYGSS